ncbi:hypothetical protein BD408DRAFT_417212 [Parasitella parasitica]|nr:hypothetical protein BD408DRAFT_417212 [Parasitella parasitica]
MTDNHDESGIPQNCKLYETVQYQCEVTRYNIECTPFVRLFLRCKGLPTVEVTPEYDQYGNPISKASQAAKPLPIKGDENPSSEN